MRLGLLGDAAAEGFGGARGRTVGWGAVGALVAVGLGDGAEETPRRLRSSGPEVEVFQVGQQAEVDPVHDVLGGEQRG